MFPRTWRFDAELELVSWGGVVPPYIEFNVEEDLFVVGAEPLLDPFIPLASLLESVLRSVRKLALERLLKSFRNEGAIIHLRKP
jgi:hypothetical protein